MVIQSPISPTMRLDMLRARMQARKRRLAAAFPEFHKAASAASCLDDRLKPLKKRRIQEIVHPEENHTFINNEVRSGSPPARTSSSSLAPSKDPVKKKSVRFDLQNNSVRIFDVTAQDLNESWLSTPEYHEIRQDMNESIRAFVESSCNTTNTASSAPSTVCVRGLEEQMNLQLFGLRTKSMRVRNYVSCILASQMEKADDMGRFSLSLSQASRNQAQQRGILDQAAVQYADSGKNEGDYEVL